MSVTANQVVLENKHEIINMDKGKEFEEKNLSNHNLEKITNELSDCYYITILNLSNNKLKFVSDNLCYGCPKLKILNISDNLIDTISSNCFAKLINLEELNLSGNHLSLIAPRSFSNPSLSILNLSRNKIKSLNAEAFIELPNLSVLNLSSNTISEISVQSFSNLFNLTELNLSSNEIYVKNVSTQSVDKEIKKKRADKKVRTVIEECFKNLSKLKDLDLSVNNIEYLSESLFAHLVSLEKLNLSDNFIRNFHLDCFQKLEKLIWLNLSLNGINKKIDGLFSNCRLIEHLDISSNEIDSFSSDTFKGLVELKKLWANTNKLTSIEDNVFNDCSKLEVLKLFENEIKSLGQKCFSNLKNLTSLDLSDNKLNELPSSILNGCTCLKSLYLNKNGISKMSDKWFGTKLEDLTTLMLNKNKLFELDENFFTKCPRLSTLGLMGNELKNLKEKWFLNLNELTDLDLSRNSIVSISDRNFSNLKSLKFLNLSVNEIRQLPNIFENNNISENIHQINLSENQIEKVPKDLVNCVKNFSSLEKIDLAVNRINLNQKIFNINNSKYKKTMKKWDMRFNSNIYDQNLNYECLFKIVNIDKDKRYSSLVAQKSDDSASLYLLRSKIIGFESQLYLIYTNKSDNNLEHFDNAMEKIKYRNWSLLDYLLFCVDFSSKYIISLKKIVENKLELNQNSFNYEFRFFTAESIGFMCERNEISLFEAFFPMETYVKFINSKETKIQMNKSDLALIKKYISNDLEFYQNIDYVKAFENIINNENQNMAIHLLVIMKFATVKYGLESLHNVEVFNDKFLDVFLPKIFGLNWESFIFTLLDFCKEDDFLKLLKIPTYSDSNGNEKKKNKVHTTEDQIEKKDSEKLIVAESKQTKKLEIENQINSNFLKLIAESGKGEILRHETVQNLIQDEWTKIPFMIYYINLFFYLIYLVFYSIYIELYKNPEESVLKEISKYFPFAITIYFLLLELIQFIYSIKTGKILVYFTSFKNIFEITNFIVAVVTIFLDPSIEAKSNIFSVSILLSYFVLLFRMDKLWKIGKYVGVIGNIVQRAIGLLVIVFIFLISFTISFRNRSISLSQREDSAMTLFNASFETSLYRSLLMSLGNLEIDGMAISSINEYTFINFLIYGLYLILIPILLINIFTGITIDELQNLLNHFEEERALTKIEYILKIKNLKRIKVFGLILNKLEYFIVLIKNFRHGFGEKCKNSKVLKKIIGKYHEQQSRTISEENKKDSQEATLRSIEKMFVDFLVEIRQVNFQVDKANEKIKILQSELQKTNDKLSDLQNSLVH
ncbi:unnamed protein product [Brachionus calyciflorus]|uniref:Uncharacterized protein n=1 Tax=Brachionus calyciflorus TaxID=104777 RepID=A0A814GWJ5_9BILA|nr:unnamed protein product [Brachionus calyciflorus]